MNVIDGAEDQHCGWCFGPSSLVIGISLFGILCPEHHDFEFEIVKAEAAGKFFGECSGSGWSPSADEKKFVEDSVNVVHRD
jgi:hypothetical protein